MALRDYMLNLVSDCALTNDTSAEEMHVTIISDNFVPYLKNEYPLEKTSLVTPKGKDTQVEQDDAHSPKSVRRIAGDIATFPRNRPIVTPESKRTRYSAASLGKASVSIGNDGLPLLVLE